MSGGSSGGGRAPSALEAVAAIARVSSLRLFREATFYWALPLALLPLALAVTDAGFDAAFGVQLLLLAILAPLLLARGVAEEVEGKTLAYLWSRPLPRWTLPVGKLVSGLPMLAVLVVGPGVVAFFLGSAERFGDLGGVILGLTLGSIAAGVAALAAGTLWVRQPMSGALIYLLLLDLSVRELPFWIHNLSLSYHVKRLAAEGFVLGSVVGLLALTAVWSVVTALRTRRIS